MKLTKFEIIIIILILGLGALFLTRDSLSFDDVPKIESLRKNNDYNENKNETSDGSDDFNNSEIEVHIDGRVKNPGVYKIKNGTRLQDLIEETGGLLDDANTSNLNLARKLKDEEKIVIKSYLDKSDDEDAKININTASKDMLTSIPGVGSKMADKIIKYRQEHPFNSVDELLNITGIGKKKFEEIKLYITTD
ncbi:helix-hairpin-helix domain-containing protein [Peptoniphilus sp.]|uniref:helix-hairpin-helix domain-containing protein n=1 Tax=Peptoniphilus sp. TaxID=1971214 RepID=UPI0039924D94